MHTGWIASAVVCVAALLGGLTTSVSEMMRARRRDRWQSAAATVVRQATRLVNTGPGAAYYPATCHYSVAAYAGPDGTEYTLDVDPLPTGTSVPILFDARRPARACPDDEFSLGLFLFLLAVASFAGLLVILIPAR